MSIIGQYFGSIYQLIGSALRDGVDTAETFAVLKGNCVVETMRKAVIAKIPVFAVCGAVTAAAKKTADEAGLRLVELEEK